MNQAPGNHPCGFVVCLRGFSALTKKHPRPPVTLLILLAILAGGHLACNRLKPSQLSTPEPSPDEAAVVNQILQRYVEAIGGESAINGVTSYKTRGTFGTSVLRETGKFETWSKDPNKTLSVIEFPRIGKLRKGFDGENRWVQTPVGTFSDESPKAMSELERDADVYRAGKLASLYESMHLDNKARLSGHDVYVIEGKPARGPAEKLFFNSESGLLERWDMARRDPKRGTIFVKVHLKDYRVVDGLKVPFNVRFAFESFDLTFNLEEVKYNVAIDDAMFRKPGSK